MVSFSIEKLILAIEHGKIRGFDEMREVGGESYFFQYALKKEKQLYSSYYFFVPEKKMDFIDDYAVEEIKFFNSITDAFDYFKSLGVGIERFSPIKGILPF